MSRLLGKKKKRPDDDDDSLSEDVRHPTLAHTLCSPTRLFGAHDTQFGYYRLWIIFWRIISDFPVTWRNSTRLPPFSSTLNHDFLLDSVAFFVKTKCASS